MSIECYYPNCKYHSDDGPFCDEENCRASNEEIDSFEEARQEYLYQLIDAYRGDK